MEQIDLKSLDCRGFNYSAFREYERIGLLGVTITVDNYQPERVAKSIIENIDKDRLFEHFKLILEEIIPNVQKESAEVNQRKLSRIKQKYPGRNQDAKVIQYENQIIDGYHNIPKSLRVILEKEELEFNAKLKELTNDVIKTATSFKHHISGLLFITDIRKYLKEHLTNYFLYSMIKAPNNNASKKPSAIHYALKVYYLQHARYIRFFQNHPEGTLKAIQEYVNSDDYHLGSWKNFQLIYNKISNYKTNRVALENVPKIEYVIQNMLSDYPKAILIAEEELKEARLKNK